MSNPIGNRGTQNSIDPPAVSAAYKYWSKFRILSEHGDLFTQKQNGIQGKLPREHVRPSGYSDSDSAEVLAQCNEA